MFEKTQFDCQFEAIQENQELCQNVLNEILEIKATLVEAFKEARDLVKA